MFKKLFGQANPIRIERKKQHELITTLFYRIAELKRLNSQPYTEESAKEIELDVIDLLLTCYFTICIHSILLLLSPILKFLLGFFFGLLLGCYSTASIIILVANLFYLNQVWTQLCLIQFCLLPFVPGSLKELQMERVDSNLKLLYSFTLSQYIFVVTLIIK